MKTNKYIAGDLVMTNGIPLGTAKDVVYRVTSSDPSMSLELNEGTVLKGAVRLENIEGAEFGEKGYLLAECCAWVKDIVPIPLTCEMLEKNGWKWDGQDFVGACLLYPEGNYFVFDAFRTKIKYVHQLQHLFFGLGIDFDFNLGNSKKGVD